MVDISKGTTGMNFPSKVSAKIFNQINDSNAFFKAAGGAIPFHGDGEIFHSFENFEANEVGETGVKNLTDVEVDNVQALPAKFYVALPFSDELEEDHPEIVDAIINKAPGAIARKIVNKIISTDTTPGFTSLGGLTAVDVDTRADLFSAMATVEGSDVGLVISSTYLAQLAAAENGVGSPAFNIVRNQNDPTTGYINEIPFYTFRSAQSVGFLADWKANTAARKVKDVSVKYKYAGYQIDNVDVARRNMFVALVEQRVTFVASPLANAIVKIAPAAVEVEEEGTDD